MQSESTNALPLDPPEMPPSAPYTPSIASGRQSPEGRRETRETILSLVELLLKNNTDGLGHGNHQLPSFEDDKDVPSVDEHIQVAGAEAFHSLERKINNLDRELRNFANAARQLGSSVAILSSAYHLRERLAQLLFLYHENAADLFPRKINHIAKELNNTSPISNRRRNWRIRRVKGKAQLHVPRPVVNGNLEAESFPEQLEFLAKEVTTFLRCLNEFPEFTDEAVNASILSFEGDLNYWASCLKEYAGQFRYAAVQRYIHDLSIEMGEHMEELTSSLSMFIEVGVPMIRFAQRHGAENLLNLSTVATFFSAVTATTLQFSYELPRDSPTAVSVNSLWFLSMVFSIAAAVNSLLGLTWKQAMYRSPGHRVPWWVLIWIKRSPLVFLVLSVACFSIGLCCFAYASHQSFITSTLTTVLTAFTSFGLAAVSAWFASERWAFARHRGQKWLSDVLDESFAKFWMLPGFRWFQSFYKFAGRHFLKLHDGTIHTVNGLMACFTCGGRSDHDGDEFDVETAGRSENGGPSTMKDEDGYSSTTLPMHMTTSDFGTFVEPPSSVFIKGSNSPPPPHIAPPMPLPMMMSIPTNKSSSNEKDREKEKDLTGNTTITTSASTTNDPTSPTSPTSPASSPSTGKQLWRNAVRNVKLQNQASSNATIFSKPRPEPLRKRTTSSSNYAFLGSSGGAGGAVPSSPTTAGGGIGGLKPLQYTQSRVTSLVHKLNELEATHDLAAHSALVRHMQFSPDGQYLATSSWDKTAVIFKVGSPFIHHRTLAHAQGFVGQVAWSPNGRYLLTKMARGIKIWTPEDGVCKKTIDRNVPIETISWFPSGDTFLSVEDSIVTKLDLMGNVLDQYEFPSIKVLDAAITPDEARLIVVGPLLRSPAGLQPSKSRVEKRIIVYNMQTKQVENTTPVLNDVKDIALVQVTRSGLNALVSYEHKAPPQLWKVELIKDRETNAIVTARISLRHTYMPKTPVDFIGPSYFGGKNNELVLCASKGGDIHIWDQESGALLHSIRAKPHGGDLTCIAWNHVAEEPFIFATGTHDGAVRVWTRHPDDTHDTATIHSNAPHEFPRTRSPYQMDYNMSASSLGADEFLTTNLNKGRSAFQDERHTVTFSSSTRGGAGSGGGSGGGPPSDAAW